MRKEFGAFLFLGLLVLSLSFASAGWLSDAYGKITGNAITGNAINSFGFNESELYCGNRTTCRYWSTVRCGGKAGHLTTAGINLSRVSSVDVLSIKCFTGMGPAKIVTCPAETSYDVCVENNNDGSGNFILLGVKYGNTTSPTCTSFTYSDWSTCLNGAQTRTVSSSSPAGCTGGVSPVLIQVCTMPSNVTCTDSDGGLNYYVGGNTTFNRLGAGPESTYSDRCMIFNGDSSSSVFSCSGTNCQLDEYGCNSEKNLILSNYNCPLGCLDGACLNVTTPNVTCIDSDGGLNYYTFGNITSGDLVSSVGIREDICLNNSLREMFCYNNLGTPQLYDCPNGCSNGACANTSISVNNTCTDSDGGLNYYVRGQIQLRDLGGNIIASDWDDCDEEEFFCYENGSAGIVAGNWNCSNGCVDGACVVSSSCQSSVNQIKNPTDLIIEGVNWFLQYNYTYVDESGMNYENYSSASWNMQSNDQYSYAWASVAELSNNEAVQDRLYNALENGLCQISRVYTNYDTEEYQNIYTCKNIWRIAQQNQQVSHGNVWNYQNDVVVIWFNSNLLFNVEFSSNNYNNCYDSESCQRIENENHQRQQTDLIDTIDKIINNKNEYASTGYLDYRSEQFVKHFLIGCASEVVDSGYEGSWYCRLEPAVCPPHGEQAQTCARWNQITGKDEKREAVVYCNPGICSGCMTPKWFGSTWDSKCIGYGFRFASEVESKIASINYIDQDSVIIKMGGSVGEVTPDLSAGDEYTLSDGALLRVNQIYYSTKEDTSSYVDLSIDNYGMWIKEGDSKDVPSIVNAYCDIDGQIKQQKTQEWGACQNNYECESNLCSYSECVDLKGIASQFTGFKGFLVKMLCRLSNPFSDNGYTQCLVNNQ